MVTRVSSSLEQDIRDLTLRAKQASRKVADLNTQTKNSVLLALATALSTPQIRDELMAANRQDLEAAQERGISASLLDRLTLNEQRIDQIVHGLRETASLPDPVGVVKRMWTRPNGLRVGKKTIPLGVIGIIYEARPNVTVDAFSLCFKAGNATVLKGGSEALHSNRALVKCISQTTRSAGVEDACQLLDSTSRAAVAVLLQREDEVDLIIPRGGEALIRFVSENSRIPIIKHYKGVCHIFVDQGADLARASEIVENAKVSRPGVCNAVETLLVHRTIAADFLPLLGKRMQQAGVELRGDTATCEILPGTAEATEEDYHAEYLDLILSVRVVRDLEQAIQHIERYGSSHTEAILTQDYSRAQEFLDRVNSSVVLVNASTRFSDGGELGLGAEIGISTTKLHAYGPMGLEGLVAEKFIVYGDGQIRE